MCVFLDCFMPSLTTDVFYVYSCIVLLYICFISQYVLSNVVYCAHKLYIIQHKYSSLFCSVFFMRLDIISLIGNVNYAHIRMFLNVCILQSLTL